MPNNNGEFVPPTDIPWRLVTSSETTSAVWQPGVPYEGALAIYQYEPRSEEFEEHYPEDRIVYFKIIATIEPRVGLGIADDVEDPFDLRQEVLPVWNARVELRLSTDPFRPSKKPYFHSAAPLRRAVVETGVIGDDSYEGESKGAVVGSSGSQLHETVSAFVATETKNGGWNMGIASGGSSATRTAAFTDRNLEQYTETMERRASEERSELLSHTTNVHNVLTLLNAKYLGTPFLRLSLRPKPLRLLSIDPADPNTWYNELLRRRSSGIEGIQEFFAVAVVPRRTAFCIDARLRMNAVGTPRVRAPSRADYDNAPGSENANIDYLFRKYPSGTPVEDLDVEVELPAEAVRPCVAGWGMLGSGRHVACLFWTSPLKEVQGDVSTFGALTGGLANYKMAREVHRERLDAEYTERLAESPLENGIVITYGHDLRACFQADEPTSVTSPAPQRPTASIIEFDAESPASGAISSVPARASRQLFTHMVTRWNVLEAQLAAELTGSPREAPLELRHPRVVRWVLDKLERLPEDDRRNLPLREACRLFGLSSKDEKELAGAGITDTKGLVRALRSAKRVAEYNERIATLAIDVAAGKRKGKGRHGKGRSEATAGMAPTLLPVVLSVERAAALESAIAEAMGKWQKPTKGRSGKGGKADD